MYAVWFSYAVAPTGKPRILTAKNVTDTLLELAWNREDCRGRNGEITGYVVQYNEDHDSDDVMNMFVVLVEGEPSQSGTIDSLSPNTSYMFQVAAVNANGTGPLSEPYSVTTLTKGIHDSILLVCRVMHARIVR